MPEFSKRMNFKKIWLSNTAGFYKPRITIYVMKHEKKSLLEKELKAFGEEKEALLKTSVGKYALLKGKEIIGVFESQNDAIKVGIEKFGNEPFLVKKIEEVEQKLNFTSNLIISRLQKN